MMRRLVLILLLAFTIPFAAWAEKLSGTYFFGGSGLDGPYIQNMVRAFKRVGIKNVHAARKDIWSQGSVIADALSVMWLYRRDEIIADFSHFHSGNGQFNLVGYSYGSIQVAQIAADYAEKGGVIAHLVLIASPIHLEFLNDLIAHPNIKHIHLITLEAYGDEIRPTHNFFELIVSGFKIVPDFVSGAFHPLGGHFILVRNDEIGQNRLLGIATKLYEVGLR